MMTINKKITTINNDSGIHRHIMALEEKKLEVARKIRERMAFLGLSTYDVELRTGGRIDNTTVWSFINNRRKAPKAETVWEIARAVGLDPDQIVMEMFGAQQSQVEDQGVPEKRAVTMSSDIWTRLEADAARCLRSPDQQLEAVLRHYFQVSTPDVRRVPQQSELRRARSRTDVPVKGKKR
jgi:transcriptional regulator with XRE-family HTH domain